MKKRIVYMLLFVLLAVSFSVGFLRDQAVSNEDGEALFATVIRGELSISVTSLGVLDAAKSHMLSSTIRGNQGKIIFLVRDGSWVEKDEVLVRLDPSPFEKEVLRLQGKTDGLRAGVEGAKQLLAWEGNQLGQNIAAKKYDLKVSELELKRFIKGDGPLQLAQYQEEMGKAKGESERYNSFLEELLKLEKQGFENPSELVRARENATLNNEKYKTTRSRLESYQEYVFPSKVEAAKAKVENSRLVLDQSKKAAVFKIATGQADLNLAKGRLQTSERSLKLAKSDLANTTLKAPFAGIAILYETFRDGGKRKPRVGDGVLLNQPLLYLPDISKFIVRTKVREMDLHKIRVGQDAHVSIDAYPSLSFSASVQFIGSLAAKENNNNGKYFQVVLALDGQDQRLRPGMTARALIHSDKGEHLLLLPVQAVFTDDAENVFCYLPDGSDFRKASVLTGRKNEMQVEILSGLNEGDRVSLLPPEQLR